MNAVVLIIITIVVMFVAFRAIVDFNNDPTMTINEWVELNIQRIKKLFKSKK